MTLCTSTKSVVLVVLVSSVVVCSGKSYFPYIQSSSQYPIGSRDVYNGFNTDWRWNLNDEYFDGSDNYWTGFRNGLQRRHRVRRQQPLDQKAEFEAKIAILRRLGIIKPTSTIQQPPPQSQPASPQIKPAASPNATEPSPKTQEPQSPPQPQPVGAQPVVPRPQAGSPQSLPPPDTPALLPEPAKASPTPDAKPATESPNPSPKPQPTINPYLPAYPNRSYLNNPKEANREGPQPGPVPNQGIPERSTTPAPKVENTTPINRQQQVVNQPRPKPPQYPKQQVLTPINRQQQVVSQPQYPKQVLTKSQPPPQYPNQQYRPLVADPRYPQQPQYPDPRYNFPSSYNPQQINPQGFYPRQPLNKQPVTARAPPPPVYRPGAAPTRVYRPGAAAQPPTYGQPASAQSQPYRPQAGPTPTSAYRPPPGVKAPAYRPQTGAAQPPTSGQQPGAAQQTTYRPQTGGYPNQYYPTQGLPNTQGQFSQTPTANKAQEQEGQRKSLQNPSYQPPAQAPVIVDPYTGQEYYQVPGILPPFTDKLNQLSLELLNQSLPTPTPPLHPPYSHPTNGYSQPLGGITPEVDDDAEAEAIEDRMELLRMLQAQGNHIDPNSPQLSTLLHQMMEEGELEFDDDGFLPPTINPTATVTDPTVFGYQQMGEFPTNSQVPYWYDGSSYNRDGSETQQYPDGIHQGYQGRNQGDHQGYYQGKNQGDHQGYHQGNFQGNPQGHLQVSPQDLPKGEQPKSHQEWHMHPSVPGILTRTQVTNTPPLYRGNTGRENSATAAPPTISPAPNNRDAQEQIRQQQLKSKQRIEYLMMLKKKLERFAQLRKQLQQRQRAAQSTPATVDKMILRQSVAAGNNPQGAIIGQQASQPSNQVPPSNPQSVPASNGNPGRPNQGANGNQGSNQALQGNPNSGSIGNQGKPNQGTNTPTESTPGSNGQKVQAALVNQQATKPPEIGSAGNFSAVAMVADPGMSKSEVTGVIIGTLLGIVVVLVPLLCLLMRYRKHLKLKRKRFFPRPYSKRSDATRGSHDAMDTMVYSELGKQTLAFDSDGNGNTGNHESDYLVSLPGTSINDNEAVYNNNMDGQGQGHLMSLTSSKRADSVEISRLLTLRETERKPKVPDATKRPALPTRGKVKATLQQHGSLQMLH